MTEPIGFIGLGHLGLPIARNLLDAGVPLRVYNRTASKAEPLLARGAHQVTVPADAVTSGGIVVTLLWDGASVESVVASDGFLERLGPGGVHVAMSTILPETSRQLAALHARHGSQLVDAPIFGRPEAAIARKLWIPMAGPTAAKQRIRPLLEAMGAQGIFDFGEAVGSAMVVKLAGNFLIGSALRSLTEALAMAGKQGVDVKAVLDMLTQTLFPSPIYQSAGKLIVEGSAPFTQHPMAFKDLGLFEDTARQVQSPAPIAHHLLDLMRGT